MRPESLGRVGVKRGTAVTVYCSLWPSKKTVGEGIPTTLVYMVARRVLFFFAVTVLLSGGSTRSGLLLILLGISCAALCCTVPYCPILYCDFSSCSALSGPAVSWSCAFLPCLILSRTAVSSAVLCCAALCYRLTGLPCFCLVLCCHVPWCCDSLIRSANRARSASTQRDMTTHGSNRRCYRGRGPPGTYEDTHARQQRQVTLSSSVDVPFLGTVRGEAPRDGKQHTTVSTNPDRKSVV